MPPCAPDGNPSQPKQGSEGSKERQLDALHGEGEALLRENATLRQQVAGLEVSRAAGQVTMAASRLPERNLRVGARGHVAHFPCATAPRASLLRCAAPAG